MTPIKTLADLKKIRNEALARQQAKNAEPARQVIVAMGTCGIAVGARETLQAILDVIASDQLADISVSQTGCIGLCEKEPIVQVVVGSQPRVTYGKVDKALARRILREHVVAGKVVSEAVVQ